VSLQGTWRLPASRFRPDPFLVAAAARPDAVFSHRSALELLGAAHTVWTRTTLYTRRSLPLTGATVRFLEDPAPLAVGNRRHLGTRRVERRGRLLEVTGPERLLARCERHRPRSPQYLERRRLTAIG